MFAVPVVFAVALFVLPAQSAAQAFVNPFIGYNFSGDAGCPEILDCEDKALNWGVALGAVGAIVGGEIEFGYSPDFFGETSTTETNVLTIMGNFLLAPRFGPIQPYGLAGLGMIRSSVDGVVTSEDESDFGYDVGGGLMVFFGSHFGIRGDVRYFRSFNALDLIGLENLGDEEKLDFGRVSGGVIIRF
jgi:opacity protein-like surface antigen